MSFLISVAVSLQIAEEQEEVTQSGITNAPIHPTSTCVNTNDQIGTNNFGNQLNISHSKSM